MTGAGALIRGLQPALRARLHYCHLHSAVRRDNRPRESRGDDRLATVAPAPSDDRWPRWTFTTAAFDRSSSWRFEALFYRTAPKGPPSSLVQHGALAPLARSVQPDRLVQLPFRRLLASKHQITASRGTTRELIGVLLKLERPRARLSRSETRGRAFSCLGEFLWYLSGKGSTAAVGRGWRRCAARRESGRYRRDLVGYRPQQFG